MTDLSYDCEWNCVIALDDWLAPNSYSCKVYFDIETDDGEQQNIAFERCKIMLHSIFDQALFININNPLIQTLEKKTKQKIITLPNEPIDVIMAAMIYTKLNAISEGRLLIRKVKLRSTQGDNIWIHFDNEFAEDFGSLECEMYKTVKEEHPWWENSDPSVCDWFEIGKKEIKFHKHKSVWEKSLLWEQSNDNKEKTSTKWKPKVIDGGKETKH